jgi:hypothetical protein
MFYVTPCSFADTYQHFTKCRIILQYRILPENGADLLNGVDDFIKYDLAQRTWKTLTAISALYTIFKSFGFFHYMSLNNRGNCNIIDGSTVMGYLAT